MQPHYKPEDAADLIIGDILRLLEMFLDYWGCSQIIEDILRLLGMFSDYWGYYHIITLLLLSLQGALHVMIGKHWKLCETS